MRFEIRYPTGSFHQVELQGTLITLGRDPGCDLVLSDLKCSRRHAVIEAGAQGLTIRDTGSANGVFVNAKKVERATVEPGDLIRVGEVILKVLPEEITGTVVMGPDELEDAPAEPGDEAAASKERPAAAEAARAGASPRTASGFRARARAGTRAGRSAAHGGGQACARPAAHRHPPRSALAPLDRPLPGWRDPRRRPGRMDGTAARGGRAAGSSWPCSER